MPKFFRILRSVGLTMLAISDSVLAAPIALPAGIGTGVYLRLAFNKLLDLVYAAFATQTTVMLRIEKKSSINFKRIDT